MSGRVDLEVWRGEGISQEFLLRDDDGALIDVDTAAGDLSLASATALSGFGLSISGDAGGRFVLSGAVPLGAVLGVFEVHVWMAWKNGTLPSPELLVRAFLTVRGRPA